MLSVDRLYENVRLKGPVCVGLDTAPEYLPPKLLRSTPNPGEAVLRYNKALIDGTFDVCACYKVQIAYYEALGLQGLSAYGETLRYLREKGALAIGDIKRGDIADTAARYAAAHFAGDFETDMVTLSPYMGMDSIDPWLSYITEKGKGAFVLMRTSNPGMRDFEYRELSEGGRLYNAVGAKLDDLAKRYPGTHGYGAVGAVVGCTEKEEAAMLRAAHKSLFFLIPGYGAQGGAAEDAALLLHKGNGGVVNASRSILKAWTLTHQDRDPKEISLEEAAESARGAVIGMRDAILAACAAKES